MQEIKIVSGASYGDEGKGLATDFFACRSSGQTVNVLTNGGPQRGHTVELDDGRRHVFKHFGAGTFRGAETYFAEQFMVNPMEFVREYDILADIHGEPASYAAPGCRFTTPWDMLINQFLSLKNGRHNTCGFGIWETYLRYMRGQGISLGRFAGMSQEERHAYLCGLRDGYFICRAKELGLTEWMDGERGDLGDVFFAEGLVRHYEEDFDTMLSLCPIREEELLRGFGTVIFENAQGLLLDGNREAEKDKTTPSTTGIGRVLRIVERQFRGADVEAIYVTRSYLTRHGEGTMENELSPSDVRKTLPCILTDRTNKENCFQGSLRYGILDEKKLADRIVTDFRRSASARNNAYRCSVMMTHLNEYGNIDTRMLAGMIGGSVYLSDGRIAKDICRG